MNRKFKRPFWSTQKVPKEQRGVNRANQRSENGGAACGEGLTGPYAKDFANAWDTFWRIGGEGQGGVSAQGVNRMESAGIRPIGGPERSRVQRRRRHR